MVGKYGEYPWHISFVMAPNLHAKLVNAVDPQARTTSLGIMLEMTLIVQPFCKLTVYIINKKIYIETQLYPSLTLRSG